MGVQLNGIDLLASEVCMTKTVFALKMSIAGLKALVKDFIGNRLRSSYRTYIFLIGIITNHPKQ